MWPKTTEKKSFLKDKVILQQARETEELQIEVDTYMGKGRVLLYECNRILVDPDCHQELLHNYEYEAEVLVVLSLIFAYLYEDKWDIPTYSNDLLPNVIQLTSYMYTTCIVH